MLTLLAAIRRHALLFLFLLTAAALILLARDWLAQHDARLKLESTLAAQQKIVTDSDQRQSARDAQLTQTLSQIAALKKSVQTPQQSAAAITNALSQLVANSSTGQGLPTPLEIDLPSANAPIPPQQSTQQGSSQQGSGQQGITASSNSLPPASLPPASASQQSTTTPPPAILRIPQNDLKPLFDTLEDCQICRAQLTTAQSDLADERSKSAALTAQRNVALKSAHGTFWTRARTAAKWLAIGAAAGALLARAH